MPPVQDRGTEESDQGNKKAATEGPRSLLVAMCDHVVFDAVVDVTGKHAMLKKIRLSAVGTEADNATCPGRRHAGNLKQFVDAGVIDVDTLGGRWSGSGFGRGLRRAGLRNTRDSTQARGK